MARLLSATCLALTIVPVVSQTFEVLPAPPKYTDGEFTSPNTVGNQVFTAGSTMNVSWTTTFESVNLYLIFGTDYAAPITYITGTSLTWWLWDPVDDHGNNTLPFSFRAVDAGGSAESKLGGGFYTGQFWVSLASDDTTTPSAPTQAPVTTQVTVVQQAPSPTTSPSSSSVATSSPSSSSITVPSTSPTTSSTALTPSSSTLPSTTSSTASPSGNSPASPTGLNNYSTTSIASSSSATSASTTPSSTTSTAASPASNGQSNNTLAIGMGVGAGIGVALIIMAIGAFLYRRRQKRKNNHKSGSGYPSSVWSPQGSGYELYGGPSLREDKSPLFKHRAQEVDAEGVVKHEVADDVAKHEVPGVQQHPYELYGGSQRGSGPRRQR